MLKLYTAVQMREMDRAATEIHKLPSLLLMEHAGYALARAARHLAGLDRRGIVVVCGKGNNGGDGLSAARWLQQDRLAPQVYLVGRGDEVSGDAAVYLEVVRRLGARIDELDLSDMDRLAAALERAPAAIDALLGTGLGGAPREPVATAIRCLAEAPCPIVSADIPSGVNSDTGTAYEPHVKASRTVTFAGWKRGLVLGAGAAAAGEVELDEIGMPHPLLDAQVDGPVVHEMRDVARLIPRRALDAHKGEVGRVLVVGGSRGLGGAPLLAARAAARAGSGLVTVGLPASLATLADLMCLEVMTRGLAETAAGSLSPDGLAMLDDLLEKADVLAVGPGLGTSDAAAEVLRLLADRSLPLVIDADGLNLLARHSDVLDGREAPTLLTPHPGEGARLLDVSVEALADDPLAAAERIALRYDAVTVLKFARTVIAEPGGRQAVNINGTPAMASGGMGDALTGVVASLLGQGLAPYEAAVAACWLHGRAGELAAAGAEAGLLAGDLVDALPRARAELRAWS